MPLQKQNIPIIFGKGIETKFDEKVVQADKMHELENAVFTKKMTLSTRYGADLLGNHVIGTTTSYENAKKLMTFQDELLLVTNDCLFSYIQSNDAWSDRGSISAVAINSKSIVRNSLSQSVPDGNSLKGVSVYAYEQGSGINATVIDDASGLPILSDVTIAASGVKPKVFASKTYLLVYFIDGSNWKLRRLNPFNPSVFETVVTVASNIENNYDLHPHGNNLVYIFNNNSGVCEVGYVQQNGLIGTSLTGSPAPVLTSLPGDSSVAIVSKFDGVLNDAIYALYANPTDGLTCSVLNLDLSTAHTGTIDSTTTVIRNITGILIGDTTLHVYYELFNATKSNALIKTNTITFGGVVGTAEVSIRSLGLTGKAFLGADSNVYMIGAHESTLQSTYFVLNDDFSGEKLQVASVIAKYEGGGLTAKNSSLSNIFSNKYPNLIKTQLQSVDGNVFTTLGVQVTEFNFDEKNLFNFKEIGKNVHIAGGMLYDYDGVSAFEHNFHFFPEPITENTRSLTGGNLENGSYQYVFCYEWTDNQGQLHRSAPSIPFTATFSGGTNTQQITFNIPTLRVTKKTALSGRTEVLIVGYRTKKNETTFYRFTSQSSPKLNDTTVDSVTITDLTSDATIGANDVLYTTGGVLENYSPGSARLVEEYRNRLIVAGLEDGMLVRYSKEHIINESMDFAEELSFRADSGKGRVEGIARLDEKLLIFKESEIYYQIGQGPTSTGALDDYQQPIFITTDVGTTEPRSIVSMPLGIMFKSNKGYYLLSRSLEPIYIGQSVERYNNLTVTGAILCDQFNEVRFTTSDGVTLSYNYNAGEWSAFTYKEALSSVLWQNKWTILKDDGSIYVENTSTYFDGLIPVTKKITTAWIQAANLQGAQRIYRVLFIGKLKSKHRLKIDLAYDFDPSIRETFLYDTETILGSSYYGEGYYGEESYYGGADPVYQIEIRPGIQKCQAIRFTIQDLNDDGVDGAGFELTGMTIQVGIKQGLFRPNIDKRVGPS